MDPILEFFALSQGVTSDACALCVTPNQFVRIQIGRVAWQEVQSEPLSTGQDVLKAWALGARGTMIGRAMSYGLGAMGEAGVTKALEIIHKELDITMVFCGHTDIRTVGGDILVGGTPSLQQSPEQTRHPQVA